MNSNELKSVAENLIETTDIAGKKSIELYEKGLKKITLQLQMVTLKLTKLLLIRLKN